MREAHVPHNILTYLRGEAVRAPGERASDMISSVNLCVNKMQLNFNIILDMGLLIV